MDRFLVPICLLSDSLGNAWRVYSSNRLSNDGHLPCPLSSRHYVLSFFPLFSFLFFFLWIFFFQFCCKKIPKIVLQLLFIMKVSIHFVSQFFLCSSYDSYEWLLQFGKLWNIFNYVNPICLFSLPVLHHIVPGSVWCIYGIFNLSQAMQKKHSHEIS